MEILKNKIRNVLKLYKDASFESFYFIASELENKLKIKFESKIDDFDELYWVFNFKGHDMILNYSTYEGISIYKRRDDACKELDEIIVLQEIKSDIQKNAIFK